MKKLKKTLKLISPSLVRRGLGGGLILFLTYTFFPIITYPPNYQNQPWSIQIIDRNWNTITNKAKPNWYYKFIEIKPDTHFIKALLTIEDENYYNHYWIDLISKLWAIKNNITNNKIVSWWSTITEQYIKNKFFINSKRTYLQKSREALLALYYSIPYIPSTLWIWENKKYLKEKILNLYCHNAYFWNNLYGLWAATEVYFWKEKVEDLTQEEITLLISLLHNPWIKSLEEKSFQNYFEKVKNKLWYTFERTIFKLNKKQNIDQFPFVTNRLLDEINYSPSLATRGLEGSHKNISIQSSINQELQQFTKDILNETLKWLKDKNVTNWAIIVINPKTMETIVYQWSKDFYANDIDWQVDVIKSKRQLWSTIKPFLYLQALQNWANPNDLLIDLESEYNSFKEWKTYISENYSLKEYWLVTLKKALWNSLNNATVRLAKHLWLQEVYEFYETYWFKFDFPAEHYWYSLVLGNPDITLEDLILSYINLLPNYEINTNRNITLQYSKNNIKDLNLNSKIDPEKFLLYNILKDPDNRDISFWVNSILNTSIYQAVKTWTSSEFRDNLVISYHPDLIVWVWIGNNDSSSMQWVTGITWAGYIWHQIIEKAINLWYIKEYNYEIPESVEETEYCLDKSCFRKRLIFQKKWKQYFSRTADWIYDSRDLFEDLDDYEREKLEEMNIYLY